MTPWARTPSPPQAQRSVHTGFYHNCAIDLEGRGSCWGWARAVDELPLGASHAPLASAPDHTCPLEGLGLEYLRQGRHGHAEGSLRAAVEESPHTERSKYVALAQIHQHQGRPDQARAILERGLSHFPADPGFTYALAELDAGRPIPHESLLGVPDAPPLDGGGPAP